jgi:NAD(P)-dependent dehydrogenase (short-subunit alcohol dehydrogenase family)
MVLRRVMAADCAKDKIWVNGTVPGTIETTLARRRTEDPETRASLVALHPTGRIGTPEATAAIGVFLTAEESRFATVGRFFVDGGITVR